MTEAAASDPSGGRMAGFPLRGPARLLSDERLSQRATTGDRRAFEEIFRRYHQDLYRFCLATVSNPQDAQEALQNTMVKVLRALPGEQREIKLKPWLFRIARNEAIETMRKRRDTVDLGSTSIAAPWEIADAAGARARLRELFSDLSELPERQRSTLVMRELAGLNFDEIGETLGTSAPVARQTLYEARQSLRQMEEGREMSCASIRKAISDADGRVTRRRDIRAHLRDCVGCSAFREDIAQRRAGFASLAPLPLAVSTGMVQGVLSGEAVAASAAGAGGGAAVGAGGGAAAGGGLGGSALGLGAGKAVIGSALAKGAATVAVVAAVGVGADRGGVIDLPTPGGGEDNATRSAPQGGPGVSNGREAAGASSGVAANGKRAGAKGEAKAAGAAPPAISDRAADAIPPGRANGVAGSKSDSHASDKPPRPAHQAAPAAPDASAQPTKAEGDEGGASLEPSPADRVPGARAARPPAKSPASDPSTRPVGGKGTAPPTRKAAPRSGKGSPPSAPPAGSPPRPPPAADRANGPPGAVPKGPPAGRPPDAKPTPRSDAGPHSEAAPLEPAP